MGMGVVTSRTLNPQLTLEGVDRVVEQRARYLLIQRVYDRMDDMAMHNVAVKALGENIQKMNEIGRVMQGSEPAWDAKSDAEAYEMSITLAKGGVTLSPGELGSDRIGYYQRQGKIVSSVVPNSGLMELEMDERWKTSSNGVITGIRTLPDEVLYNRLVTLSGKTYYLDTTGYILIPFIVQPPPLPAGSQLFLQKEPDPIPDSVLPGDFIHDAATNKYFVVTYDRKLTLFVSPEQPLLYRPRKIDSTTPSDIRDKWLRTENDLSTNSQTQALLLQKLTSELQSIVTMLTNILKRLRTLMSEIYGN